MKTLDFEIMDHGCDGAQYFPGCGVAFSRFTDVVTGIGGSAREAGNDALDQLAWSDSVPSGIKIVEVARILEAVNELSDAPSFDPEDPEINPEWHHYVSIRWRVVET